MTSARAEGGPAGQNIPGSGMNRPALQGHVGAENENGGEAEGLGNPLHRRFETVGMGMPADVNLDQEIPRMNTNNIITTSPKGNPLGDQFARGGGGLTMSSQDIAELTVKRHDNVLRDARLMLIGLYGGEHVERIIPDEYRNRQAEFIREHADTILDAMAGATSNLRQPGTAQSFNGVSWERDAQGRISIFHLDKSHTLTLISGYNVEFRKRIIDRWLELEEREAAGRPKLPNFSNLAEAARAWADEYERKLQAEQQRDVAVATKAEIGTRREATAMNTASQAVKKATKLELELDRARSYATVKRMTLAYHGQEFNWRLLKSTSIEMGIPPIDVFDQNYGTVRGYHADVWREAYALEIPAGDEGGVAGAPQQGGNDL